MNSQNLLSPQQIIVMQYLVNGSTIKEIAGLMNLARGTVRKHVQKTKSKLGAKTHDQAVALVVARGDVTVTLEL